MAPERDPQDLTLSNLSINASQDAEISRPEPSSGAFNGPLSRVSAYQVPNLIVRAYLRKMEPVFCALDDLREKIWGSTEGDAHFKKLRERADSSNNDKHQQMVFWKINLRIGLELREAGVFFISDPLGTNPTSLHLCMAPGGYTDIFLQIHPEASVKGITLPQHLGGHPMCIPHSDQDPRVEVEFMDLTMLAVEYGTSMAEIPKEHPDAKNFSGDRLFLDEAFNLVICDGQVLRTHFREDYRQTREALRLNVAQLIFGMTRIKQGGTFVMLLHKADAFDNIELLETFDTFSKVKLVKPTTAHSPRSSFYLVAEDVDPTHRKAQYAIEQWKKDWKRATLGGDGGTGMDKEMATEIRVNAVLEKFGPKLIELAKPMWSIQKDALNCASYIKPNSPRKPTLQRKPQDENTAPGSWRKTAHANTGSPKAKSESVEGTPSSSNVSRKW